MTSVRSVVCGTDFTEPARAAADLAAGLAAKMDAELVLVHVDDTASVTLADPEIRERIRTLATTALEAEAARLRGLREVKVTPQLLRGSPAAELARVADLRGAHLIVVAAAGPTPSMFRVGGTAERVAQAAHVPVLLARDPAPLAAWLRGETLSAVAMIGEDAASDRVIEWLRELRGIGACNLSVLHAYYVDEATRRYGLSSRPVVLADPEIEGYVQRDLEHRVVPLGGHGTVAYHAVLAHGRLADHLTEHPSVRGAGLIVVGNHRARGLARLSSVAAGVVHLAPVSLLIVPLDAPAAVAAPWPEIRRVLAATDFSEFAAGAIRHAYGLVAASGGEVTLLHILSRDAAATEESSLDQLRSLAPAKPPPRVTTRLLVERHADPATAIHEIAARTGADCIVIASHGRTGLRSLFLGSVAQGVIHHAHRPVLVVRPPGDL